MADDRKTREEEFEEFRRSRYPSERSRELAERAFAESRGEMPTKKQATMLLDEWLLGPGKKEGPVQTFTDPEGFSRTYRTEDASLLSEGRPAHYSNMYSPYDRRQIEKLYQERSRISTDPELTEPERQQALDRADQMISRVPRVSPIMQQPSAQERFDASLIKAPDGTQGTIDKQGNFRALELNKAETDAYAAYQETLGKNLDSLMKENAAQEFESNKKDIDVIVDQAQTMAALVHGFKWYKDFKKPLAPSLDQDWAIALSTVNSQAGGGKKGKKPVKATEGQMQEAMAEFARSAVAKGYAPELAYVDFLDRWYKESADEMSLVPEMPDRFKQEMALGKLRLTAGLAKTPADMANQPSAKVNGREIELPTGPTARMSVGKGVPMKDVAIPGQQPSTEVSKPTSEAEYNALPSGALYLDPNTGAIKRKR